MFTGANVIIWEIFSQKKMPTSLKIQQFMHKTMVSKTMAIFSKKICRHGRK
jgi:hypothetical protein